MLLACWSALVVPVYPYTADSPPLEAGAAKEDITPDYPCALDGYSNPVNRVFDTVHDRIYVRAVVFRSGAQRLVLVSADVTGFILGTNPSFQQAILARFNLQPDELFLAGTHTHSSPMVILNKSWPTGNEYKFTENLRRKTVDAIDLAFRSLRPIRLGVGRGTSDVAVNRRLPVEENGKVVVRLAPNPDGPVDQEVLVLKAVRSDGAPVAALFDYACHSRSLGPPNKALSGDIFGLAEQFVEQQVGRGCISPAFAGASGDVDPMHVVSGFTAEPGRVPETVRMGTLLGEEVGRVWQTTQVSQPSGGIETLSYRLRLPRKRLPAGEQDGRSPISLEINVARIGHDLALVGLNCEAFTEIGLAIKKASPFKYTFIITHCNGGEGYLPTASAFPQGGYEVGISGFAPQAADMVAAKTVELLHQVRGKQ